ncbi:uncharacterized protein VTP21DRAFT_7656 [Calcarisporiella thermophila]|uniref:uncharacterized protein n=1 Tax=Calcarisporiella thermophila TaxID=911321 RepID=UPI0037439AB5
MEKCSFDELKQFWSELEGGHMPTYGSTCENVCRVCHIGECPDADKFLVNMIRITTPFWKKSTYYTHEDGGDVKAGMVKGNVSYVNYPPDGKMAIRLRYPIFKSASVYLREVYPGFYFGLTSTEENFEPAGFFTNDFNSNESQQKDNEVESD